MAIDAILAFNGLSQYHVQQTPINWRSVFRGILRDKDNIGSGFLALQSSNAALHYTQSSLHRIAVHDSTITAVRIGDNVKILTLISQPSLVRRFNTSLSTARYISTLL